LRGAEEESLLDATFAYVNPETMENITVSRTTQLMVMTDSKDVDIHLFECINGASLVYDGRLVVDGSFRTNDPSIYAAGTIARFTRNLATVNHCAFPAIRCTRV
jgi:thioredoxin reductase